ncbi:hypothetical protein DL768_010149 [Monosporascus sp. mg162]|nr:hypothetical protein DL768_010149 [Monosporascus sp. mg162]
MILYVSQPFTGDIPDLVPVIQATNDFSNALFTITTQKLGTPLAQLLFPGIRKPLIILEDPREIEDIVVRRHKEFDKALMAVDIFPPMFPHASLSQYTAPELKAQKRLWADVMGADFLRKAAAANIYKATLELLELWRLKASTVYKDQPFSVHEDFQNAALDAIWVTVVGEEPGVTRYEIKRLQNQIAGTNRDLDEPLPRGSFLKEEVAYIGQAIARNSSSPFPKWSQKPETYTPRYHKFRATVSAEIGLAMGKAVDRFHHLEMGKLEADELDTCMMDFVLRRQILESKKARKAPTDPTKDQNMLDEMFVMLVGGNDSTANALTWFVRYMEACPAVQAELRAVLKAAFPGPDPPTVGEILETEIPYLDGACEEGFRLAGVAKANLRQALVDTDILGYSIPKGAEIFMNYHINRAPVPIDESKRTSGSQAAADKLGNGLQDYAGRDLGSFEPRRWLVKDEETGRETFNAYALPSLAFGGGYRGCAGRKLASMEFRIVVVLLILKLDFLELPEEYKTMRATEKIFRQPDMPFAKVPRGDEEVRNIVIVGASFAGYPAARVLANSLPFLPGNQYRLVVVEPHSHFHFTWVLPRFCVVKDHEHKAFIPYGGYLGAAAPGVLRWTQDHVVCASRDSVRLSSGEEIPYAFLIVATGSGSGSSGDSLPSRVDADGKKDGIQKLKDMQLKVEKARNLVVVGGGAAGVELAADAKDKYPEKKVVIVHSRDAVMHRFGPGLQTTAMDGLRELGVDVITGERVVGHDAKSGFVTFKSGRRVECDVLINCTGQRPASQLVVDLSPDSVLETGQIRVKPTLQIPDDSFPNVYACGDVAETGTRNPNARSAMRQGMIAAENVLLAIQGKAPRYEYIPHFADGAIGLTVGLQNSVAYVRDGDSELLFRIRDKDITLRSGQAWSKLGAKPFEDDTGNPADGGDSPGISHSPDPADSSNSSKQIWDREALLELSDSVRASIQGKRALGPKAEELRNFLETALKEEERKHPTLDFDMIEYARLDKLLAETLAYAESLKRSTLASELSLAFRVDISNAKSLRRAWRRRFREQYFMLDQHRCAVLLDSRLKDVSFETALGYDLGKWQTPASDPVSELEGNLQFEPGHWWLNLVCAMRDGIVSNPLEKPTKGRYGMLALPLLTGQEELLSGRTIKYTREGKASDMHISLISHVGRQIRILRGYTLKSVWAPQAGTRYDGLYIIKQYGTKFDSKTNTHRLELTLERVADQKPIEDITGIPEPSQLDDWKLFEKLEGDKIKLTQGEASYLEWKLSRRGEQVEREEWRRSRLFRSSFSYPFEGTPERL